MQTEPATQQTADTAVTYMLRTCNADLTSYNRFQWPSSGPVSCSDWRPRAECGNGLHGLLMGAGAAGYLSDAPDAKWLVVEVLASEVVDIDRKVKVPGGNVVFCGDKHGAVADIIARGADPALCVYSTLTGGDGCTLTGGVGCTLTGGDRSTLTGGVYCTLTGGVYCTLTGGVYCTLTGGDGCTLTGGDRSTLTGGDGCTLTGGVYSTLTGGDGCTLTGGVGCTLTGGDYSTLTGGDRSTLTGGDGCTLTGGVYSTLTGGDGCTLTGGVGCTLICRWWDGEHDRYRTAMAECSDCDLTPGQAYVVRDGKFIQAEAV